MSKKRASKQNNPLVSVVIPVFNGEKYLEEALDSVLGQSYQNFEIVVVDDGSSEGSIQILQRYSEENPEKLKVHYFNKNLGMDHALNHALSKMSKGSLIARFNQDDIMPVDRLSKQVEYMKLHPECAAIGGQVQWIDDEGKDLDLVNFAQSDKEIRKLWMYLSPYDDPAVMYRYDFWQKTGGYDQDFWPADDVKMWYQLGAQGELINHPEVMNLKRWHDGAGSSTIHRLQIKNTWKVRNWAKDEYGFNVPLRTKLFWIGQYVSGMVMPARFNWWVYRLLKGVV